jgi:hypothetical protein
MIRQTVPLLVFSLFLASIAACIPPFFAPITAGNANTAGQGFLFPMQFGFFVPFAGTGFNNPFMFPSAGPSGGGAVVNSFTSNVNFASGPPDVLNENGLFNLNLNATLTLNSSGAPAAVNQNLTP